MVSLKALRVFLQQVRNSIDNNQYTILDHRFKYQQTLAQLGIINQDVIDDIYQLTEKDLWTKKQDDNPMFPGDVWICKKYLHGELIYIKLKIKQINGDFLVVLSYHINEQNT